ncbi:unnamed protein product, partial [Closterium sp. NIES-53]
SGGGGGSGSGGGSDGFGGGGGGSVGGGGSGGGRAGATRRGGSTDGQRQQYQRRNETPLPLQLREWFSQRGPSGGSGSCPYVIRTSNRAGQTCGKPHTQHRCFSCLDDAWHAEFGDEAERPRWEELLRSGVAIFDLDYDAIIVAMYALSVSAEGDCYLSVPPDPGIEAAALGAGEAPLPDTVPAEALHTFTLDSGASSCSFRDSTTLTTLSAPVPVRLADPSGGQVVARSSTVLPWLAVPSGSQSGLHLPSFSTNLVSTAALQDAMVTTTAPGGVRVTSGSTPLLVSPPVAPDSPVHHRLGHPSLPRLRGMHSRLLVSGLPRSLPPLPPSPAPPCLPCVEGRQRAAPHSSSFPPTTAPLQTLHMDMWGTARVSGQSRERYFLLVVDYYMRYTTVFPLRSKGGVPNVLIPWIRAVRLQLCERFRADLPVLRLHSDRGGEFSSDLLREFFRSPFSVAVCGPVGDASVFRVWGSRAFVRDLSADKLSARVFPCVFLGFSPDAPSWQFYHPTSRRVFPSQDVTFDESVPIYRIFPYRSAPPPPPPLFFALVPPPVDPLPPQGSCSLRCAPRGAAFGGAEPGSAEPRGAESEGNKSGGTELGVTEPGGAEPAGVESKGAEPDGVEPGGAESGGAEPRATGTRDSSTGDTGAGGAGVTAGACGTGGAAAAGPRGACTRGTGATGTGGVGGAGAGDSTEPGAARTGGTRAGGAGAVGARAGGTGVGGAGAGGAGAVDPVAGGAGAEGAVSGGTGTGGTTRPRPRSRCYSPPLHCLLLLLPLSRSAVLQSVPASPVCTGRRVLRPRPPPVRGTHAMALRPSSVSLRASLSAHPESSLPAVLDPESDGARAARPTVSRLLATVVTDPSFESTASSALVAELVDYAAAYRVDYATALVAESESASPPFIEGECALGRDVLEDRQEDFECLAGAVPRFPSMLLAPEGDPDAPDIPTPRSYAEAITVPYSSQWQAAMMLRWHPGSPQALPLTPAAFIGLRRPPGFIGSFPAGTKWSLRQLVYGLRQAPGEWHDTLRTTLAALADPSLFLRTDTSLPPFYVLLYIDDLVFATANTQALTLVKSELQKRHTCADLGELRSYLGLHITRNRARRTITLTQSHMVHQVIQRFDFQFSSPQHTPLSTGHSLSAPPSDESPPGSSRYFLARDLQQRGQLRLAYVASTTNTADIFTKELPPSDHQRFSTVLGLVPTLPHLLTA